MIRHGNKYGVKNESPGSVCKSDPGPDRDRDRAYCRQRTAGKRSYCYINSSSKDNEEGIWDANIFGKSVEQIVEDGIQAKISQMTDECQQKLQDTLQKIINDSNGGLICIII